MKLSCLAWALCLSSTALAKKCPKRASMSFGTQGLPGTPGTQGAATPPPVIAATPAASASTPPPTTGGTGKYKCPAGFRNVVFNSGVNTQPNMAGRWQTLASHGVAGWIGFTMSGNSALGGTQLPIVMDPSKVPDALTMIKAGNVPYMEIFNEPDFDWGVPQTSGSAAIPYAQQLIAAGTQTQFIAAGLAFPESSWYSDFFADPTVNANVKIVGAHAYNSDPQKAINKVQSVITRFPGKRIWITELSPASDISQGCQLDAAGMQKWMDTLVSWAINTGVVDKIYWNAGEWGVLDKANPSNCNPSLTNEDGSATELLKFYQSLC